MRSSKRRLECVAAGGVRFLRPWNKIAVSLHHGAGSGVERLIESVVEFDRRVGVVIGVGKPGVERVMLRKTRG
jgi:hypothetical protein